MTPGYIACKRVVAEFDDQGNDITTSAPEMICQYNKDFQTRVGTIERTDPKKAFYIVKGQMQEYMQSRYYQGQLT